MPRKAKVALSQPLFGEPVFSEGVPTPDPSQFKVTPNDDQFYTKEVQKLLATEAVSFPKASGNPGDVFSLATAWGPHGSDVINAINAAKAITFQMIGDSGATASKTFGAMIKVSDAVTNDFHTANAANRPAFLYHLGDIVYNFGEWNYYYDQFYEPYRDYPAPIFAIPGNHDSFVLPNTPAGQEPLTTFIRQFCNPKTVLTKEAGSLHRTSLTQPGVYFALDAPFVRIIGLFSNALEDPGVISSQSGAATGAVAAKKGKGGGGKGGGGKSSGGQKWSAVPDYQLAFLTAQLQNIKKTGYSGAVIVAVHHPPFSYGLPGGGSGGGKHYGSPQMLAEIDSICNHVGVYPHAFISGHAHNYQRFTRGLNFGGKNFSVPFIICGDSGHNVTSLVRSSFGSTPSEPGDHVNVSYMDSSPVFKPTTLTLNKHDQQNSGYLRVSATAKQLTITFNPVSRTGGAVKPDTVTVDLATHTAA
ncbi:MAG TPA: metallophosphoesterase [Candidatus Dormibacteraeota bacterium]|nr:metallophosphoesterase [Candidatus Dormibacteraeota bacterium]